MKYIYSFHSIARKLVSRMTARNPLIRITSSQILVNKWIRINYIERNKEILQAKEDKDIKSNETVRSTQISKLGVRKTNLFSMYKGEANLNSVNSIFLMSHLSNDNVSCFLHHTINSIKSSVDEDYQKIKTDFANDSEMIFTYPDFLESDIIEPNLIKRNLTEADKDIDEEELHFTQGKPGKIRSSLRTGTFGNIFNDENPILNLMSKLSDISKQARPSISHKN